MSGRNVNVYLPEETYQKIRNLIEQRKVSKFVDEAIKEKLQKEQQQSKEELRQKMIEGYKRNANNKKLREEMRAMEAASVEDVFTSLERQEKRNEKNK